MKWKILTILSMTFLVGLVTLYAYIRSYDFNKLKPEIISTVHDITGRELTIEGNIGVAGGLSPSLVIENVFLQNASWGTRPRMLHIKRFEMQLALLPLFTGTIEIRKVSLFDSEIFIEMNRKGVSNLPESESRAPTDEPDDRPYRFLPEIFLQDVRIINSRLVYKGSHSAAPVTLRLNRFNLNSPDLSSHSFLDINAIYNKLPITIKGSVGTVAGLIDPKKPWPLEITLNAVASKLVFAGNARDVFNGKGVELDVWFESQDISKPASVIGVSLPVKNGVRAAFHISGDLGNSFRISKLKLLSGKNELQGNVLAKLKGAKPYFNVTLTSDRLDLRPTDKRKSKLDSQIASQSSRKLLPTDPFPTGLLKKVDADIDIRLKQCLLARTAVQSLKLRVALKNGRMTIKPITAIIGSGKLKAHAVIREVKKKLVGTAVLKVENMKAGRMLKELDISDALEGEFDVSVDLSGRGRSVAEFMAGTNGHLSLILGKGRFNSRLLGVLGGDLRAGLFKLLNIGGQPGELTEINCFVTRFDIVKGIANARVLVLDTRALSAVGKGTVNLKTEKLDISLEPTPKKGLGSDSVGKLNFSLANLAKPFKLGGTLADPELAIDPQKTAITIGKAIGGVALFGPFGIVALLVDGDSGKKDLCASAVAIAKQKTAARKKPAPINSKKKKKKTKTPGTFFNGLKKMFK